MNEKSCCGCSVACGVLGYLLSSYWIYPQFIHPHLKDRIPGIDSPWIQYAHPIADFFIIALVAIIVVRLTLCAPLHPASMLVLTIAAPPFLFIPSAGFVLFSTGWNIEFSTLCTFLLQESANGALGPIGHYCGAKVQLTELKPDLGPMGGTFLFLYRGIYFSLALGWVFCLVRCLPLPSWARIGPFQTPITFAEMAAEAEKSRSAANESTLMSAGQESEKS